jgi:hypothetical protein
MLHSLCSDLVKVEFANTTCIEGAAGDEGIDRFIGNDINKNTLHAFQHLTNSGKQRIKESLKQVLKLH